ncbi:MAG TPA: M14-type cytosolic carboxypeptidase [Phycisphaerae bacterium]|nr:M14-type cytosolic carboxypeptidase [Phycisphaerae bacterium]
MELAFQSDFPGGNGLALGVEESAERVTVRFAAEPKNCPEAMWFHFRVAGLAGRPVRCILANPEQTLGGWDWSKNRPVQRPAGGAWSRSGAAQRIDAAGGRVEWAWDIGGGAEHIEVAHCFPYQPADMEATLREIGGAFQTAMIGVSSKGRPMIRIYSTMPEAAKPAVLLLARNHAGETPGSWVLDGALRHVAASEALRNAVTWWAVPFVDLDDVVEGSYGKDPWPHDCNRSYGNGKRPETIAVVADGARLAKASRRLFVADLHAPAHAERQCYVPTRGWEPNSPTNPIAEEFGQRLNAAVPEDIRSSTATITPPGGANTRYEGPSACRWATERLGQQGVTIEISYQGTESADYGIGDYHRIGAALAETLAAWVTA